LIDRNDVDNNPRAYMRSPLLKPWLALAIPLGIALGLGLFTFDYAEGLSYMSNDPKNCANCHIMNEQYDGWQKASHHTMATCNDCHTPHDLVGKYATKAINGYNHSKAFTLQNFHEPIRITPRNARILQDGCLHCHSEFVHEIIAGSKTADDAVSCVHCHRSVGHGPRE
jgi:cytochrome c nitrite reductase small subunit